MDNKQYMIGGGLASVVWAILYFLGFDGSSALSIGGMSFSNIAIPSLAALGTLFTPKYIPELIGKIKPSSDSGFKTAVYHIDELSKILKNDKAKDKLKQILSEIYEECHQCEK